MRKSVWYSFSACFACALVCVLAATPARAETVLISDTFDVGAAPTRLDDGNDPLDAGWFVVGRKMTPASTALTVTTDPTGLNDGNCLLVDKYAAQAEKYGSRVCVNLPGYNASDETADNVVLDVTGEYLQLDFDVRIKTVDAAAGGGFRFGLYSKDSLDTTTADPVVDFTGTATSYLAEGNGYLVAMGVNGGGANKCSIVRETENDSQILSGTAADQANFYSWNLHNTYYDLDTSPHSIRLRLTKTGAGVQTTLWIDNMTTPIVDEVDTNSGSLTSFDAAIIGNHPTSNSARNWLLDNVSVTTAVPEPSVLALVAAVVGALLVARTRA